MANKSQKQIRKRKQKQIQKRQDFKDQKNKAQKTVSFLNNLISSLPDSCEFCKKELKIEDKSQWDDWKVHKDDSGVFYICPECYSKKNNEENV